MEVVPESSRGSRVLFFIPAGPQGSGWVSVAEAITRLIRILAIDSMADRNPRQGRGAPLGATLFAEVVRGCEETTLAPKKRVSISLSFVGGEA